MFAGTDAGPAGVSAWYKFSKVSALIHLLYKVTIQSTFFFVESVEAQVEASEREFLPRPKRGSPG